MKNLLLIGIATITIASTVNQKAIARGTERQYELSDELSHLMSESSDIIIIPRCVDDAWGYRDDEWIWNEGETWERTEEGAFQIDTIPNNSQELHLPLGILLGEIDRDEEENEWNFFAASDMTPVKDISLYDHPHGEVINSAYLHTCRDIVSPLGYRLNLYRPDEELLKPNPNDIFFTGYRGTFANWYYYDELDGYFNILRNTVEGGYWIKSDDLNGFITRNSFTEFLTRYRLWRIAGYDNSPLRIAPSNDAEELLVLDERSHIIWEFTGEVSDRWAEIIVYGVEDTDEQVLDQCYSEDQAIEVWTGIQWRGWLEMVDSGGQMTRIGYFESC